MKLKIKPSAKVNRRYLLIEAKKEIVEKTILEYIGVLGWAKAAPLFVHSFKGLPKNRLILAIERKSQSDIRAAFEVSKADIKIIRISGTLKGLL